MRENSRTTVVSAVLGVVLLAVVFAFAVLVPKLSDDDGGGPEHSDAGVAEPTGGSTGTAGGPVELPDKLGKTLVAVDLGTLPADLAQRIGDLGDLKKQQAAIVKGLDSTFGAPGAYRIYAAPDGSALAQVIVLDKAPGLFAPDALPVDPGTLGVTRAAAELVKVRDAVCSVSWPAEVPKGTAVDPQVKPQGVRCQLGAGDRTYEITSQGLTVDETVADVEAAASV
jgi:hypothetical protein